MLQSLLHLLFLHRRYQYLHLIIQLKFELNSLSIEDSQKEINIFVTLQVFFVSSKLFLHFLKMFPHSNIKPIDLKMPMHKHMN